MINVAENLLIENKSIEKVFLMDCIPRFDPIMSDPHGLKPKMAKFSNNLNRELVNKSTLKNKIVADAHNIDGDEASYGNTKNFYFDGIHLRGYKGCDVYTKSIINILSKNMTVYQAPREIPQRRRHPKPVQRIKGSVDSSSSSLPASTSVTPPTARPSSLTPSASAYQYAVKTFNRFSNFLH